LERQMANMLDENVQKQVRDFFKQLKNPVVALFFGSKSASCEYCETTHDLLKEITELHPLLSLQVYDIDADAELAAQYHVDKTPAIVLAGKDGDQLVDYGIRLAGIPAGHEFTTLIHDLVMVSTRETSLSQATIDFLKTLTKPLHLQVFVTPT
jgi:glutaredoxin-like protein